jgi:hypothetical protein
MQRPSGVEVPVDVAPAADAEHEHDQGVVVDVVDNPLGADADPAPAGRSGQSRRPDRSRIISELADRVQHAPTHRDIELPAFLAGRGFHSIA